MRTGDFSGDSGGNAWHVCHAGHKQDSPAGSAAPLGDAGALDPEAQARRARLVRTIEGEIVPRLVLARRVTRDEGAGNQAVGPDACDVKELVRLLMAHDASVASAYVETVRQRGATLEQVCLDLMAPAARQLGLLWERDECDFLQVTVGLCRLHQLLQELGPEFGSVPAEGVSQRRILLIPCPGDQHTFGLSLVAQFLRRADWEVWHEFPRTDSEILQVVRRTWFAVVGLSLGSETRVEQLTETIRAIRRESRNRAIGVLVGGPLLLKKPELAQRVGADATAADGPQAVLRAEHICSAIRADD